MQTGTLIESGPVMLYKCYTQGPMKRFRFQCPGNGRDWAASVCLPAHLMYITPGNGMSNIVTNVNTRVISKRKYYISKCIKFWRAPEALTPP